MNIHDIAKIAGVSASTISKVMNGKDKDISEETRKKVLRVIEEENYVPYLKFLEKEGIRNHLIGLIVRKDNRERETIVLTTEREARENGYGVLIGYTDSEEETESLVRQMMKKKVSGLLVDSAKWISSGKLEETTVYFGETDHFDDREKAVIYYRLADAAGAATEKLLQEGHQKIACIIRYGDEDILHGYKMAMQNLHQKEQPVWTYEGRTFGDIEKYGIPQVLNENVTAIVCGSPEIACFVCKVMERSRTMIPNEISVIAVGDDRILEFTGNGITAVKLPGEKLAETAIEYLLEMIREKKEVEVIKRLPPSVINRNSIMKPAQEKQGKPIIVVGSMNMDVTIECSTTPVAGETQRASKVYIYSGGKGANQAVGVGKLGGQVYMIGCLGNDMDGKQIYAELIDHYVHMEGVFFDDVLPSGKAYISVDERGESAIVIYPGANKNLNINQIRRCGYLFEKGKFCLLSLEIPAPVVEYTIRFSKRNDTKVILKPSPMDGLKEELLPDIAYFVPNEKELHAFVPGKESLEEKAGILCRKGVENVIVTLGAKGCYLRNREVSVYFEGSGFEAVDTTGGADSFISAMAVYLSEGKELIHAIEFAIYASGISVTRYGAQPAMPDRKAVDVYEDEIYSKYREKRREWET